MEAVGRIIEEAGRPDVILLAGKLGQRLTGGGAARAPAALSSPRPSAAHTALPVPPMLPASLRPPACFTQEVTHHIHLLLHRQAWIADYDFSPVWGEARPELGEWCARARRAGGTVLRSFLHACMLTEGMHGGPHPCSPATAQRCPALRCPTSSPLPAPCWQDVLSRALAQGQPGGAARHGAPPLCQLGHGCVGRRGAAQPVRAAATSCRRTGAALLAARVHTPAPSTSPAPPCPPLLLPAARDVKWVSGSIGGTTIRVACTHLESPAWPPKLGAAARRESPLGGKNLYSKERGEQVGGRCGGEARSGLRAEGWRGRSCGRRPGRSAAEPCRRILSPPSPAMHLLQQMREMMQLLDAAPEDNCIVGGGPSLHPMPDMVASGCSMRAAPALPGSCLRTRARRPLAPRLHRRHEMAAVWQGRRRHGLPAV